MTSRTMAGITLMVAFSGAFLAWNILVPPSFTPLVKMAVSGLLALAVFASWRFLVWKRPGR